MRVRTTSPAKVTTCPSELNRLTYGDFVVARRKAKDTRATDADKRLVAHMKQTRDQRAKESRATFTVVTGGKA